MKRGEPKEGRIRKTEKKKKKRKKNQRTIKNLCECGGEGGR